MKVKSVSPAINVIIERSIANFSNQQGIQKFYSLFEATEILKQYLIINFGEKETINEINKELSKLNIKKMKNYKEMEKLIERSRKKFNEAQFLYDVTKNKKNLNGFRDKNEKVRGILNILKFNKIL